MAKMRKGLLLILLLAASMAIGVTGASVLHTMTLENPIKTPPVQGVVEEDLSNTGKKVQFVNTGEADVFLRIGYTETWIWTDKENKNTKVILPNTAEKTDGTKIAVATPNWNKEDWETGSEDGWYYYKHVLPGSVSEKSESKRKTPLLVEDVAFDTSKLKDERYKNAEYKLHFTMEVVQASDDIQVSKYAVEELFIKDVGIPADWDKTNGNDKYSCTITWPVESVK